MATSSEDLAAINIQRKRKSDSVNGESSVDVAEVAQPGLHDKRQCGILEKLDKEYPGWREPEHKTEINMVPPIFSDKATKNTTNGTNAERVLFKTLEKFYKPSQLRKYFQSSAEKNKSSAFVFHGQKYEGTEIDFISIDKKGVTVYECKGITRTVQAQGRYDEACSQLGQSVPKLDLEDGTPINRVVAFPLCRRTNINREGNVQILFKEDCEDPASFEKWRSLSYEKKYFSEEKFTFDQYVDVVAKFLSFYHAGHGNFSDYKRRALTNPSDCLDRKTVVFYTKEQAGILQADRFDNLWIEGSAGSGKTFLLKERVKGLAEFYQQRDIKKQILVVTYNVAIKEEIKLYLKKEVGEGLVRVQSFTALLNDILQLWKHKQNDDVNGADLVDKILNEPKILKNYFKTKKYIKYHHILVDEAQDLFGRWLQLMNHLLNEHEKSSCWVFSDPYQVVRRGTEMPEDGELKKFDEKLVTRVLRNTHNVFEAYEYCFDSQDIPQLPSKLQKPIVDHQVYGISPEYIPAETNDELCKNVLHTLQGLQKKRVSLLDIAVITQGNSENLDLLAFLGSNHVPCTNAVDGTKKRHRKKKPNNPPVIVDTVQRFKGLEAKVLIFCIVGEWIPRDVDLYVGFSRSFCHLIVIGKESTITEINRKQNESSSQNEM